MRSLVSVLLALSVLACSSQSEHGLSSESDQILRRAFENQSTKLQVEGRGVVTRILPDDNEGSRHQRFVLKLDSGQTLLISHNIDLAQRIHSLQVGDVVEFGGEYDWNSEGGVIHWTHHDPAGHHADGWLKHKEQTYR